MIPIHFDGPASARSREFAVWVSRSPGDEALDMWTVFLDYGDVILAEVEAYYGAGPFVYFQIAQDAAYYALLGQLMTLLTEQVMNKLPPKITIYQQDGPEFVMETTVYEHAQIHEIAWKAEQSLPAFRHLVDAALPGLSVFVLDIETCTAAQPIRPVSH